MFSLISDYTYLWWLIKESDDKNYVSTVIAYRRGHKIFFCKYLTAGRLKTNLNDVCTFHYDYILAVGYQLSHCCLIRRTLSKKRWVWTSATPRKLEYSRTDDARSTMTPHQNQSCGVRWYSIHYRGEEIANGAAYVWYVVLMCAVNEATTSAVCLLCVIL